MSIKILYRYEDVLIVDMLNVRTQGKVVHS